MGAPAGSPASMERRIKAKRGPTCSCRATSAMIAWMLECCEEASKRRVLQIHQDHIRAACLQHAHSLRDPILEAIIASAPGDIVRAELPDDQVGP